MSDNQDYESSYGTWAVDGNSIPVASTYRIAWRAMAAITGFRTFYPAIIPPGAKHVHGVHAAGPVASSADVFAGAVSSTLLSDFFVRATGIGNLYGPVFENLPLPKHTQIFDCIVRTFLRLNCLTLAYAPLWENITGQEWTPTVPIRNQLDRQRAQTRIDVSVGILLGITADELCMIYRTQFPVMGKYDRRNKFDMCGRLVPEELLRGLGKADPKEPYGDKPHSVSGGNSVFIPPFDTFDRESEIRELFAALASNRID